MQVFDTMYSQGRQKKLKAVYGNKKRTTTISAKDFYSGSNTIPDNLKQPALDSLYEETSQSFHPSQQNKMSFSPFEIPPLKRPTLKQTKRKLLPEDNNSEILRPAKRACSPESSTISPQSTISNSTTPTNYQVFIASSPPPAFVPQHDPALFSMLPSPPNSFSEATRSVPCEQVYHEDMEDTDHSSGDETVQASEPDVTPLLNRSNVAPIAKLPTALLTRIIEYAVPHPKHDVVLPVYQKGMIFNREYMGEKCDDRNISSCPNIDLSLLQVCKTFQEIGSKAYYGRNSFTLCDADVADWWLSRIGPDNLSKVQRLTLCMESGWIKDISTTLGHIYTWDTILPSQDTIPRNLCCEQKWLRFFSKHKDNLSLLRNLIVDFTAWKRPRWFRGWRDWNVADLEEMRTRLLNYLDEKIRGIKHVSILVPQVTRFEDRGITWEQQRRLELLMIQRKETAIPCAEKWPFWHYIESLKACQR